MLGKLGKAGEFLLEMINAVRKTIGKTKRFTKYEQIVADIFKNPNKVNKILNGSKKSNHYWELLSPSKNLDEIASIITEVLERGADVPYESIMSKVLYITRNGITKKVQVPYKIINNKLTFGDAWVIL